MSVDRADVERTAELARLEFEASELDRFVEQFQRVLQSFEQIQEPDTSGVEPLYQPLAEQETPMRADEVDVQIPREEAMRAAPSRGRGHFRVPRVIE